MPFATDALRELIAPIEPQEFLARHWQKRALYSPGSPERVKPIFDLQRFFQAAESVSPMPGRRQPYFKAGSTDAEGNHVEAMLQPSQLRAALDGGRTVQAERIDSADPQLRALMLALKEQLCVAAEVDAAAFLSPPDHGYGLHYDAVTMFVVQLEGQKRWWHSETPAVEHPLQNRVPTAEERAHLGLDDLPLTERVLSPGDVLYLPAGAWHRARAVGQSLHLSLTIRTARPFPLIADLLMRQLVDDSAWRHIPNFLAQGRPLEALRSEVEAFFAGRLNELKAAVDRLSPSALFDAWREDVRTAEGELLQPEPRIQPMDVLHLRGDPPLAFALTTDDSGEEQIVLSRGGGRRTFLPAHAFEFVKHLMAQGRFEARTALAWDASYEWQEVEEVLRGLVERGILDRAPAAPRSPRST